MNYAFKLIRSLTYNNLIYNSLIGNNLTCNNLIAFVLFIALAKRSQY